MLLKLAYKNDWLIAFQAFGETEYIGNKFNFNKDHSPPDAVLIELPLILGVWEYENGRVLRIEADDLLKWPIFGGLRTNCEHRLDRAMHLLPMPIGQIMDWGKALFPNGHRKLPAWLVAVALLWEIKAREYWN